MTFQAPFKFGHQHRYSDCVPNNMEEEGKYAKKGIWEEGLHPRGGSLGKKRITENVCTKDYGRYSNDSLRYLKKKPERDLAFLY
jgi:hypothetical protein